MLDALFLKHPELKISHEQYNINVTTENGERMSADETLEHFRSHNGANQEAHLYFHLPLCNYICKFCNYVKTKAPGADKRSAEIDFWISAWQQEASYYLENFPWIRSAPINSIYFGGGTAALLSPVQIQNMMNFIFKNYNIQKGAEFSLEGNPDNFTSEYIQQVLQTGINRFSLGVQSLDDRVLNYSGRGHSAEMAIESIQALSKTGKPFNVDYMFGLPYQTPDSVQADISKIIELGAPTITIYRLRNADREKMGIGNRSSWNILKVRESIEQQGLFPSTDSTYEMRSRIVSEFKKAGFAPSPCGWWSKKNTYADGNIPKVSKSKWERYNTMLAYGPGAYGWLTGAESTAVQTHNLADIHAYRSAIEKHQLPLSYGKVLLDYSSIATRLGFGLKANQPISNKAYQERFGVNLFADEVTAPILNELFAKSLLTKVDQDHFQLSEEGETLHEEIISVYIHEKIGGFKGQVCKKMEECHA